MKSCIIFGAGISIREGISLGLWDKIKDEEIWSVNFSFMTMPYFPKREIWMDLSFFKNNLDKLQKLYLQGVLCYAKKNTKYALIPEIIQVETTRDPNEANSKVFVGRMGLSGILALSLAVKEEYDLIYLLGFDWGSATNDKNTHYYQNELNVISSGFGRHDLYVVNGNVKNEVKDFELFLAFKSKIVNVSPMSRIEAFEKIDYPEFFSRLENNKKE